MSVQAKHGCPDRPTGGPRGQRQTSTASRRGDTSQKGAPEQVRLLEERAKIGDGSDHLVRQTLSAERQRNSGPVA